METKSAMETNSTTSTTSLLNTKQLPARFDLNMETSAEALENIKQQTNGFSGINQDYVFIMSKTFGMRNHTWSSSIDAPDSTVVVKQIIGKNGFHLKKYTTKYGVDLIWHNRNTNQFTVWGGKRQNTITALHAVNRQVIRFVQKQKKLVQDVVEMETNMSSMKCSQVSFESNTSSSTIENGRVRSYTDETENSLYEPVSKKAKLF